MKITIPVILQKMLPRVDKSWVLSFETRELFGKDIENLANRLGTEGWIVHSPNDDITVKDVPEVQADAGLEGKTPSQRLRSVLRVYWEQSGKSTSWEQFYLDQMERLIEAVKNKLD